MVSILIKKLMVRVLSFDQCGDEDPFYNVMADGAYFDKKLVTWAVKRVKRDFLKLMWNLIYTYIHYVCTYVSWPCVGLNGQSSWSLTFHIWLTEFVRVLEVKIRKDVFTDEHYISLDGSLEIRSDITMFQNQSNRVSVLLTSDHYIFYIVLKYMKIFNATYNLKIYCIFIFLQCTFTLKIVKWHLQHLCMNANITF